MKKLITILAILSICSPCFATDTYLGQIKLTDKQFSQTDNLKSDVIKGFSLSEKGVVVVSTRPLTYQEKTDLISNLEVLPDEYTKKELITQFNVKTFFGRIIQELTPERWLELSKLGIGWTMQQLAEYPNFEGLKIYIETLRADGTLKDDDVKAIVKILAEQGIIL